MSKTEGMKHSDVIYTGAYAGRSTGIVQQQAWPSARSTRRAAAAGAQGVGTLLTSRAPTTAVTRLWDHESGSSKRLTGPAPLSNTISAPRSPIP
jgi:hypothetical protein